MNLFRSRSTGRRGYIVEVSLAPKCHRFIGRLWEIKKKILQRAFHFSHCGFFFLFPPLVNEFVCKADSHVIGATWEQMKKYIHTKKKKKGLKILIFTNEAWTLKKEGNRLITHKTWHIISEVISHLHLFVVFSFHVWLNCFIILITSTYCIALITPALCRSTHLYKG